MAHWGADLALRYSVVGIMVLGLALGALGEALGAEPDVYEPRDRSKVFARIAGDLMGRYKDSDYTPVKGKGQRMRVAVWPLQVEELGGLSMEVAEGFSDALIAALQDRSHKGWGKKFDVIGRDSLAAIVLDMDRTGKLDRDGREKLIHAVAEKSQDVDVIISGNLSTSRGIVSLSYTATRVDALLVGKAKSRRLRLTPSEARLGEPLLAIDQAVERAADDLYQGVGNVDVLILGGISFEATGTQPDFGRYLQGRVSAALSERSERDPNGGGLQIQRPRAPAERMRGLTITTEQIRRADQPKRIGEYRLEGTYWELEDSVDVQLNLQGASGETASWAGRLRKDEIENLLVRPRRDDSDLRKTDHQGGSSSGSLQLTLQSGNGSQPIYRFDESFELIIHTNIDSHVYCFYFDANDNLVQILPNRDIHSSALAGGRTVEYPRDSLGPRQAWTVSPPAGEELVKCFATTRDVQHELPESLRGLSFDPLPAELVGQLSGIFARLTGTQVAEQSMAVTVLDPSVQE